MKNQFKLFKSEKLNFGGGRVKGNPKTRRPFSKKCDVQIVMRSQYAVRESSLLNSRHRKQVRLIIEKAAKRFYVTVRRNINVGNHLHLLIHTPTAQAQRDFLRTVAALIARQVTGARKGTPMALEKFWDARPFSRLIPWGRAYKTITHYLSLNSLEAIGFTKTEARKYLADLSTA